MHSTVFMRKDHFILQVDFHNISKPFLCARKGATPKQEAMYFPI